MCGHAQEYKRMQFSSISLTILFLKCHAEQFRKRSFRRNRNAALLIAKNEQRISRLDIKDITGLFWDDNAFQRIY